MVLVQTRRSLPHGPCATNFSGEGDITSFKAKMYW
jgi:hypothetical protein